MAGYTRQSTYTDGDVIQASDSNTEFDQYWQRLTTLLDTLMTALQRKALLLVLSVMQVLQRLSTNYQ